MTDAPPGSAYLGPDWPRWDLTLKDGSRVLIRPLDHRDADADRAFIQGLSPRSRRMRFLGQVPSPGDVLIDSFTDLDFVNDLALAAVTNKQGVERIVGISRYAADADRQRCECAVVVADEWQRKGLGTALMERLIVLARERGMRLMESIDLAENAEMRELAGHLGFRCRLDPDDPRQVIYSLDLREHA